MNSLFATSNAPVTLLPAAFFFTRSVPVDPQADREAVVAQVELALEAWSPFPVTQLYYGSAWRPGSSHAVVYAAYRRRFTVEAQAEWETAEWVAPSFAPWLLHAGDRAEAVVLRSEDGLTVLHWAEKGSLPTQVITRPWPPEATDEQKQAVRDEVVRSLGGSLKISDFDQPVRIDGDAGAAEWTFGQGDQRLATLTRGELDALDVRDRGELSARRRARSRDHLLWRAALVSLWVIVSGLVLQAGLWGATRWERTREERLTRRAPEIEAINRSNELASRIEELATKRLRPFEMIDVAKEKKPPTVVYKSLTTVGLNQLEISGSTNVAADLPAYRSALTENALIEKAEFTDQSARDGITTFRLLITFKADAFRGGPAQ